MLRPTFFAHEHDKQAFCENDDFLIMGRDLLVASVVKQRQRLREVYLPDNDEGWYCFYSGRWYSGGQTLVLDASLERLPVLEYPCHGDWAMWIRQQTITGNCGCSRPRLVGGLQGCCLKTMGEKATVGSRITRCGSI